MINQIVSNLVILLFRIPTGQRSKKQFMNSEKSRSKVNSEDGMAHSYKIAVSQY
ncbi:hypothetical protein HNV12_11035 [Methanococcoides sp. SA1]|nr:hypothetical protein [Methanococcoides sp. SA1]